MSEQVESPTITLNATPAPAPVAPPAPNDPPSLPQAELAKVRDALVRSNPNAVPELIQGSTVDELVGSIDDAVNAYHRIAEAVRPEAPNVPAGASTPVNLADLPSMELIRRGVAAMRADRR